MGVGPQGSKKRTDGQEPDCGKDGHDQACEQEAVCGESLNLEVVALADGPGNGRGDADSEAQGNTSHDHDHGEGETYGRQLYSAQAADEVGINKMEGYYGEKAPDHGDGEAKESWSHMAFGELWTGGIVLNLSQVRCSSRSLSVRCRRC